MDFGYTPQQEALRQEVLAFIRENMAQCPVCRKPVDEAALKAKTGETAYGAKEVDPTKGTRQFHEGVWYYFDSLECRTKFMARPDAYLTES